MELSNKIQFLKGVGEKRAKTFEKIGIYTIADLISHYPFRYIDYSTPTTVEDAVPGEYCVIKAEVYQKFSPVKLPGGRQICKVATGDDTGSLSIAFFSQYTGASLETEKEYLFYGKVMSGRTGKEMLSPEFISAGSTQPLTPVYHLTASISQKYIAKCMNMALVGLQDGLQDVIPQNIIDEYGLIPYKTAIKNIHQPSTLHKAEQAKNRLIFDELLTLQLGLLQLKSQNGETKGIHMPVQNLDAFYDSLPFTPTNAQLKAITEITDNMQGNTSMNRLLQGDVGTGKTLVACAGMVVCAQNGYQSVLMAPTEILATQHLETLASFLAPLNLRVDILTAAVKGKARTELLARIERGEVDVLVGTHAVLSENVKFAKLGFVVTDEQHRFGVKQRAILNNKAENTPHVLVMSATPIPRTLGLLMFGDLDVSVLDEAPKGRQQIKTYLVDTGKRQRMFGFIDKHKKLGEQTFIVCPLIEESDVSGELMAVTTYFEQIAKPLLPECAVALLHGKMKATDKATIMKDFTQHKYDVLCSTTVIEVGVDVPNATVMVIENAERYGLSALHQLRGRVGRGSKESFCILVSDHKGEKSTERLKTLCNTSDGFVLAQYDMETRGVGDFFGNRQHGLPTLKLANLMTDSKALYITQNIAQALVKENSTLSNYPLLKEKVEKLFDKNTAFN